MKKILPAGAMTAGLGFFARASNQLSALVLTLVAARHLAPAEFGIFSLAVISVTLIRTLLYCGAYEFLLKAANPRACARESLVVNMLVTTALSIPCACVALIAYRLYEGSEIAWLMLVLLPSTFLSALVAWQESLCLRAGKMKSYYVITTAAEIVSTVLAIGLFFLQFGLLALILKTYIAGFMAAVLYARTGTALWSSSFDSSKMREIIRWSLERYGAVLLTFGSTYAADLILGALLSPAATGLYRGSSRLVTSVSDLFNQPTRLMGMTYYSARAAKDVSSGGVVPLVFAIAAAAGWSALGGLAVASPVVVPLLLGPAWANAVPIVAILCIARAFSLIDACVTPALVAYNRQRIIFQIQLLIVPILLLVLFFLSPYGVLGATVGVALVAVLNTVSLLWNLRRHIKPPASAVRIASPIAVIPGLSVAVGALAASHLPYVQVASPGVQLVIIVAAGAVCWALALFTLRRPIRSVLTALTASA